jgi:Uma2 family endonuclease
MRPQRYIPNYTYADYKMWEGDWELIDGVPVSMSPSPIKKHQSIGGKIYSHILVSLDAQNKSCGDCEVVYELDWIVNDTTVLRPDIAMVCTETNDFITKPPILIVEILSPSTALRDRQVKYDIYQEQGVKYYIIVDPATKKHRAFQLKDGAYYDYNGNSFVIHEGCIIAMDIAILFDGVKR